MLNLNLTIPSVVNMGFLVVTLAITFNANFANAESPGVCQLYAQNAVSAFQEIRNMSCSGQPHSGARWQDNYDNHYNWCLNVNSAAVQNERRYRENLLRVCRKEPSALGCHNIASAAVEWATLNFNKNCGYTGPRWIISYDDHLAYCLSAPSAAVMNEHALRFSLINLCVNPTQQLQFCDLYAKTAVNQAMENNSRKCGGTGNRWLTDYDAHCGWCTGLDAKSYQSQASSEEKERGGPLSLCRTLLRPSVHVEPTSHLNSAVRRNP